jgi:hypothetical protein
VAAGEVDIALRSRPLVVATAFARSTFGDAEVRGTSTLRKVRRSGSTVREPAASAVR